MARIAHEVMVEAERVFRRADALAGEMEPHLLKRLNHSAIYAYTNDRADRNVPPGDVLLAAALAAGISLDHKLGLARDARDAGAGLDELRAQMAEMRRELEGLRAELSTRDRAPTGSDAAGEAEAANAERAARRREWARRSTAATPPAQSTPNPRRSRGMGL